eukprot:TRINITY_DN5518_c0_g1_i1.p1 TRINITY_DN5518_c0_g1~~TRINITY_DN5518_c0_g1_i1.p1  ORF type:complete len:348 (+),score=30.73 TRINITY_DN5518_c0_g1_i1:141-1184(+)
MLPVIRSWSNCRKASIYYSTTTRKYFHLRRHFAFSVDQIRTAEDFFKLKSAAVDKNDLEAHFNLGQCYWKGNVIDENGRKVPNTTEAFQWWKKAADQGHAQSAVSVGDCFLLGLGTEKNADTALSWYKKAAILGNAQAAFKYGAKMYEQASTSPDAQKEAFHWLIKAAQSGLGGAQDLLAWCYHKGYGVTRDVNEAAKLWKLSAEQGVPQGQFAWGICLYYGRGVPAKDVPEAMNWLKKAAHQGNVMAMYNLGRFLPGDENIPDLTSEAAKWMKAAAEKGHVNAQHLYGMMHLSEQALNNKEWPVVKENLKNGMIWLQKAAEAGDPAAAERLKEMMQKVDKMTAAKK